MRHLILGIILGVCFTAGATWASHYIGHNDAQEQLDRMQQNQERFNQEVERQRQEQERFNQNVERQRRATSPC